MDNALDELRAAMDSRLGPTPFVGTGLSLAISGQPQASWRGLLLDGVEVCRQRVSPLPHGWADRMKDELDNADVFSYLAAADQIVRRLRAIEDGKVFDSWIQTTVGNLKPRGHGEQIIKAVRRLGDVIVTTNYDTLIEDLDPSWTPYAWSDPGYGPADREAHVVLHMHGVAKKPGSVILSSADYERLSTEELAQLLDKGLFARHRFVFIGCGDGLGDPNIAPLLDFVNKHMPKEADRHYLLVTGGQLRGLIERPISRLISPVAYGNEFGELSGFLQALADREEIRVPQDPEFYERHTRARPKGTVFDLAGQAEGKLDAAVDALHRNEHALHQVEQLAVPPPGSDDWEYEHQKAVHNDLAASLALPTEHLVSCSADLAGVFGTATAEVWELAPTFSRNTARLARITERISRLADTSEQLLGQVLRARDDLRDRIDDLSRGYQAPYRALHGAAADIDRAHSGMASLRDGLSRLQGARLSGPGPAGHSADPGRSPRHGTAASQGPGVDAVVTETGPVSSRSALAETGRRDFADIADPGPGAAESNLDARPPRQGEAPAAAVTVTDLNASFLQPAVAAAAGLGTDRELHDEEPVPVPSNLAGDKVIVVLVMGESMAGDDIHDGYYLVVDTQQSIAADEIAVFEKEGVGQRERFVKRVSAGELEAHYRSSSPGYPEGTISAADNARLIGKVIAVVREIG